MLNLRLRTMLRGLAIPLALVIPTLALSGCDSAVGTDATSIGGTYTGSATSKAGTVSYSLEIPDTESSAFAVTGTIYEDGKSFDVRGTAIYDHPRVTFELSRVDGDAEDLFGLSGEMSGSREMIVASSERTDLTLKRD